MGGVENLHLTLEQVLIELKKALATIKKEKDLFQKMKQIYRGADMPSKFESLWKSELICKYQPYDTDHIDSRWNPFNFHVLN